jgi:hypothetical protein
VLFDSGDYTLLIGGGAATTLDEHQVELAAVAAQVAPLRQDDARTLLGGRWKRSSQSQESADV